MAAFVFNIGKGRVIELYSNVENNNPANCAIVLVVLETAGLEADAVLKDADSVAALVAGTTSEQTVMGRKTLTDADLAALPAPDDSNDRYDVSLPTTTWVAPDGNPVSKLAVCYDPDTTAGTDADLIPLVLMDFVHDPNGVSNIQLTGGVFFRASDG